MNKLLNIETEGYMKINNPIGYAEYDATPYEVLNRMIEEYPFSMEDCFVDFGCGKGRVVCFAADNGCCNVIGIEFNEIIYEILLENISKIQHSNNIRTFNQKAETWAIDPKLNKCFFYNPFYLKYFIKVYNNIIRYSQSKNILLFLYDAASEYQKFLNSQKNVILEKCIKGGRGLGDLLIYRVRRC